MKKEDFCKLATGYIEQYKADSKLSELFIKMGGEYVSPNLLIRPVEDVLEDALPEWRDFVVDMLMEIVDDEKTILYFNETEMAITSPEEMWDEYHKGGE